MPDTTQPASQRGPSQAPDVAELVLTIARDLAREIPSRPEGDRTRWA
jgi:hypothetical protein